MALLASQGGVSTSQWKVTAVVIKVDMVPAGGIVTGRTVFTKLPIVLVILLMTRIAICRRVFELLIYMARLASHFRMPAL